MCLISILLFALVYCYAVFEFHESTSVRFVIDLFSPISDWLYRQMPLETSLAEMCRDSGLSADCDAVSHIFFMYWLICSFTFPLILIFIKYDERIKFGIYGFSKLKFMKIIYLVLFLPVAIALMLMPEDDIDMYILFTALCVPLFFRATSNLLLFLFFVDPKHIKRAR